MVIEVVLALLIGILIGVVIRDRFNRFRKSTGNLLWTETEEGRTYTLQLDEEPSDLLKKRYVVFKVSKKSH